MVRLEEHKHQTENRAIQKLPVYGRVYIPLSQHIGKICAPLVKAGDSVALGQKIAAADSHVYAPIHASVSGKVVAIDDCPHPVLGNCKAIIIDSDESLARTQNLPVPSAIEGEPKTPEEIEDLSAEQIRSIVLEAGVVGMGGASFPAHLKLNPPKPVDTLIINGAECEPYLTSDYRLMIEKTKEILLGVELIVKCLGVKKVIIAIEDNKPEAIKAFNLVVSRKSSVVSKIQKKVLESFYPQGGEKQLIKNTLRREVPSGKLPFDVGVVVHNVATVYAIYEAVYLEKPLYERVVTVSGDCLGNPGNFLVRIGTPFKDLIAQCSPLKQGPEKVISGGPMMGVAQYSLDTPVVKSTNGIICLKESEVKPLVEALCVRCGRCVEYCPVGLMPCMIGMASEKEKWDLAKAYGCLDCMECGLCNYICPQRKDLLQSIKKAQLRSKP
ncbi:MAG: electron transport complex subunit RsxC [Candidatus Omnitrophica bacterium]|nr:electron transport complex subunit RsxC [Candidatus Omnitrophota bacterium]